MKTEHFNQLTPSEAERLALLAEECAEVIQVIGKVLRHGYASKHPDGGPTNRELLEVELGHVGAASQMMYENSDINSHRVNDARAIKAAKVHRYLHHN